MQTAADFIAALDVDESVKAVQLDEHAAAPVAQRLHGHGHAVQAGAQPIVLFGDNYPGFLIAILPPGAFILLGCMIAWKNWIDARAATHQQRAAPEPVAAGGCH